MNRSPGDLNPAVNRKRLCQGYHTRVAQWHADRVLRARYLVEGAVGRVAAKEVLHVGEELDVLPELVGGVQVRDPVARDAAVLVALVAGIELAREGDDIGADFPFRREP